MTSKFLRRMVAALTLFGAAPATAQVSYDYIEFVAAPYFESPVSFALLDDKINFSGSSFGGSVSHAFHPNWHVRVSVRYDDADSGQFSGLEDPETGENVVQGKLTMKALQIIAVPTFNVRVGKATDVLLGLGALYADRNVGLTGRIEGVGSIEPEDVDEALDKGEWGVYGTGGVRSRVWRGLELFGNFEISSVALLENQIFFDLGARYHFFEAVALAASVGVDTDSFIGGYLGLRFDYDRLYRMIGDDD